MNCKIIFSQSTVFIRTPHVAFSIFKVFEQLYFFFNMYVPLFCQTVPALTVKVFNAFISIPWIYLQFSFLFLFILYITIHWIFSKKCFTFSPISNELASHYFKGSVQLNSNCFLQTVATACMFLASKAEETPRWLGDLVVVAYKLIYKWDPSAPRRIRVTNTSLSCILNTCFYAGSVISHQVYIPVGDIR